MQIKSPEQVEFAELFKRLEGSGLRQKDVARRLEISPGAVSQYLTGGADRSSPSARTLSGLKEMVEEAESARARGERIEKEAARQDDVQSQLDYLRDNDPASYEVAKVTVKALHQKAMGGVSSKIASVARVGRASASALARREHQEHVQKQKAASPSGSKSGPKRGAPPQKGHKPEPPTPAQE